MHTAVNSVQCTMYNVHFSEQCTMYSVYSVYCTWRSVQCRDEYRYYSAHLYSVNTCCTGKLYNAPG